MHQRQPIRHHPNGKTMKLPKLWLFTDLRNDSNLEQSIARLPRFSGIVFRHYHLDDEYREDRFQQIRRLARRYGHILLLAGSPRLARLWKADGVHGRDWSAIETRSLIHSAPVHDPAEMAIAKRHGAELLFISPIFRTRSHPAARPMNRMMLKHMMRRSDTPVILLGGMSAHRFRTLRLSSAHGWAAIDALA
jgi:thiamine-phosphate pyrophosphorylase